MTVNAKMTIAKAVQASFRSAAFACLAFTFLNVPAVAHDDRDDATVRVMTRNLYVGSTADAVTAATSFPALVAAAAQVYQGDRCKQAGGTRRSRGAGNRPQQC